MAFGEAYRKTLDLHWRLEQTDTVLEVASKFMLTCLFSPASLLERFHHQSLSRTRLHTGFPMRKAYWTVETYLRLVGLMSKTHFFDKAASGAATAVVFAALTTRVAMRSILRVSSPTTYSHESQYNAAEFPDTYYIHPLCRNI